MFELRQQSCRGWERPQRCSALAGRDLETGAIWRNRRASRADAFRALLTPAGFVERWARPHRRTRFREGGAGRDAGSADRAAAAAALAARAVGVLVGRVDDGDAAPARAERQLAMLDPQRIGAEDLVAPALQRRDLRVVLFEGALAALAADGIATRKLDVTDDAALAAAVADCDVVVGAVPGELGYRMLERVIDAGKPIADISFSPEDPMALDARAKERGVSAVVDCGVAPGISNWLVGHAASQLDEVERVDILVGGLPAARTWPYEYRAVFSPTDVIEEYVRPCRMVRDGKLVTVPALTEVEPIDVEGIGTLEAFNTDGLRTLLHTVNAHTLSEKTLRFPGHADKMRMLRDTGFFADEPIEVDGAPVRPRAVAEKLLFDAWALQPGEREFTVLRVTVAGMKGGQPTTHAWQLLDWTDLDAGATSMARTTGFPCAIVARMLADGTWSSPGVHPPEHLGRDAAATQRLLSELNERGVDVQAR